MRKRILVIDDDQAARKSFLLTLGEEGYQVDTAESGEKGIEMTKKAKYDLVFLDLKMPGMNGVQTLRRLRKTDNLGPIYIVTAFHEEFLDQLKSAEQDGIDFELLQKPVDAEQLVLVAKGILEEPTTY